MINFKALFVASVALSSPAMASPTYLLCTFPSADGKFPVQITADEANSSVTLYMPTTGHTEKLAAAFTPDQVVFGNYGMSYQLKRTDLSIIRVTKILSEVDVGECSLAKAPKRAF